MVSALADGESTIRGLSPGRDVAATSQIMEQLGALRGERDDLVTIVGPSEGLRASDAALDCGNSGTTMRLLAGVVSAVPGEHELIGDASLSQRPMDRVAEPLSMMGSRIDGSRRQSASAAARRRTRAPCAASTTTCRWPARR